jgi:BRCT domain type II-containing protein
MARKSRQDEIFEMLRARGLRKRVARSIAEATGKSTSRTPKVLRNAASDLKALASELEDRATGGPAKRKAAAKKAANTRKRKANARSAAAKKGARTRAKARS